MSSLPATPRAAERPRPRTTRWPFPGRTGGHTGGHHVGRTGGRTGGCTGGSTGAALAAVMGLLSVVALGACGSGVRRVPVTGATGDATREPLPGPLRARSGEPGVVAGATTQDAATRPRQAQGRGRVAHRPDDQDLKLPDGPTPSQERAAGPFGFTQLRDGTFGGILHGVGPMWTPAATADYCAAFADTPPALLRMGLNLESSPRHPFAWRLEQFEGWLATYPHMIPCVTLKFDALVDVKAGRRRGLEREVLSGALDAELDALADVLAKLDRPSFLRVGPEVNGPWNGYSRDLYPRAYRAIVERFRRRGAATTIFVWNVKVQVDDGNPALDWDPGDAFTDWWSIDLFSEDLRHPKVVAKVEAFLAEAERRGKPVMIPESCPSGLDIDDPATWRDWFLPYFALINDHPGVKAFLYTNRDYVTSDVNLVHWGDMRIDRSLLAGAWRTELSGPQYVHETHLTAR